MFDYVQVRPDYVCDRWEGRIEKDADLSTLAPMYTGVPPRGDPPSENPQSLIDLLEALEPSHLLDEEEMRKIAGKRKRDLSKDQSNPAVLYLRVNGMTRLPSGQLSYRMASRDGHYVGRTSPTHYSARKGDILKVQANDFMQAASGDFVWQNPHVVSHYTDAAHSLKELEALAGGAIVKDGPAGDVPASSDTGATSSMPSGPTLEAVHIPAPLRNISLFYGNKKLKYNVQKANTQKQLVYGVVLEPHVIDSQNDYMMPEQVERAAHTYMKKGLRGKATVSKLGHRSRGFFKNKASVVPVESFIAPTDFSYDGKEMVKKGTWVMVLHVEDPQIWENVLKGEYTGLSIGGTGIRQQMVPPAMYT